MARAYCSNDDVQQYLPNNLIVEGDPASLDYMNPNNQVSVLTVDIAYFIQQASQKIDAALRTIYYVPLKKINQTGTVAYPDPIPHICALLASQMIYEQKLQGTDRARSEAQKEKEKMAINQLAAIQNGEMLLDGVKMRGGRFISNTLYNVPKNPAEGGRTKGDN